MKRKISGLWKRLFAGDRGTMRPPDGDVQPPDLGGFDANIGRFVFLNHTSADAPAMRAGVIPVLSDLGFYDVHFSNRAQAPQIAELYKARLLTSLARCRWFMVFVTRASIRSAWVRFEVDWASRHKSHDDVIVVTSGAAKAKSLNRWLVRAPHVAFDPTAGSNQGDLRAAVMAWADRSGRFGSFLAI